MDLTLALRLARYARTAYWSSPEILTAFGNEKPHVLSQGDVQVVLFRPVDCTVLAFKGTNCARGWRRNLQTELMPVAGGRIHAGFLQGLNSILPSLRRVLRHVGAPLYLTGHSAGGALASLAGTTIANRLTMSFGAPRLGDRAFAKGVSGLIRVVHAEDLVPKTPPVWQGYRHGGQCWRLHRSGRVTCGWSWWNALVVPGTGKGLIAGGADHSMDDYIAALEKSASVMDGVERDCDATI